jgi:multisubunit Na+/H+ antiporter MnhF subunit
MSTRAASAATSSGFEPQSDLASQKKAMSESRLISHILPTAATMVGVCLTVIGLIKVVEAGSGPSILDEVIAVNAIGFLLSAILSYISLRSDTQKLRMETWADHLFIGSLGMLGIATVVLAFELA